MFGQAFLVNDAISFEKFLSSQITIASGSYKYLLFSRPIEHHFNEAKHFVNIFPLKATNTLLI